MRPPCSARESLIVILPEFWSLPELRVRRVVRSFAPSGRGLAAVALNKPLFLKLFT
jgi:hypothetical protein